VADETDFQHDLYHGGGRLMPVVLQTERKHIGTRVFWAVSYVFLAVGAASMIYPFLMMVSGSFKSRIDAGELDVVPRFLNDDELVYQKYAEAKYGEDISLYNQVNGKRLGSFSDLKTGVVTDDLVQHKWHAFLEQTDMPPSWYMVGFGPTLDGRIIQKNERAFRNYIKDQCDNNLLTFRTKYQEPIENWFFLKFRAERLTDRNYHVSKTKLMAAFYAFKQTLPAEDRIYVSCDHVFRTYLKDHQLPDQPVLTKRSSSSTWAEFVRNHLHPQFINVDDEARENWIAFLKERHGHIDHLNKRYPQRYTHFEGVPLPPADRIHATSALTDYMLFYADASRVAAEHLWVDTPDLHWRAFADSNAPGLPQVILDERIVSQHTPSIKRQFATRNYTMVFEYILLYGKGIRNTVIYCLLSILLALLINPMAAYALSRYQLPGTYKILLFLIATMAFPTVVTMIPNFLLLRDLGLLNTFAALLLPTMANGYSVFLLKGFFDSLPQELFEAAEIDGAGEWTKFWMLTMNLSKPILAVIALGAFTGAYSNFMYAFILCQDRDMWTLMVWLYQLQQFSSQGVVFASLLVAAIPTLLVFVLCQNIILRGIVVPTEK
jgi:ABC-type glycerol-3-phosphate transport system permease component